MSKKIKIFRLLTMLGLMVSVSAMPVWAQETSSGAGLKERLQAQKERLNEKRKEIEMSVGERRNELKTKMETKKEVLKEKREAIRGKLEAKKAERVRSYTKTMIVRFEAAIKRLDNLAERIRTRLDKLAQDGKDVTASKSALEAAKTKIESAKSKLAEAAAALEKVVESEIPQDDLNKAKTILNEAKDVIKMAQAALVDVVNSIKSGLNK